VERALEKMDSFSVLDTIGLASCKFTGYYLLKTHNWKREKKSNMADC
jgi:hypothetical protein